MKPSKMKKLRWAYAVFAIVFLIIFNIVEKSGYYKLTLPLFFSFGIVAVIFAFLDFAFWRCTHCGAYLGRSMIVEYCHKCGEKLE